MWVVPELDLVPSRDIYACPFNWTRKTFELVTVAAQTRVFPVSPHICKFNTIMRIYTQNTTLFELLCHAQKRQIFFMSKPRYKNFT